MSALDCCDNPRHEFREDDGYGMFVCVNCGEWWPVPEYNDLALADASEEEREADQCGSWMGYGLDALRLSAWDKAARAFQVWHATLRAAPALEPIAWDAYEATRQRLPLLCNSPSGVAMGGGA